MERVTNFEFLKAEKEVREGEQGFLQVYDLANVFSVALLQAEDLAVKVWQGFRLLGRNPSSELRGCTLMPT